MIKEHQINQAIQRIVSAAQPNRVILFGSYGRNEANEDSDLDLLVVESEVVDKGREMARLRAAVGFIGIGVDVLVFSEAEMEKNAIGVPPPSIGRSGKVRFSIRRKPSTDEAKERFDGGTRQIGVRSAGGK